MNENLKTLSQLLGDFSGLVANRSTALLFIFEEPFSKILEWHFKIWKREYLYLGKQNELERWSSYDELSRRLDAIFQEIGCRALKDTTSFSFFKKFKKHVEEHKNEVVEPVIDGEKRKFFYADFVMGEFYRMLFENAPSSRLEEDVWKEPYFPKEWKVTKVNLQDKNNVIAALSLKNFIFWAQDKIQKTTNENKSDLQLDRIAANLFPELDPPLWAKLLTFLMRPWGENRMESLIQQGTIFGHARPFSSVIKNGNEHDFFAQRDRVVNEQEQATLELAILVFPDAFTVEKMEGYLNDLQRLERDSDSIEESRRKDFISIFKNIKKIQPKKQND